ncbi:SET domain-containing protein [Cucurbitaria berberidis CBS 394.84]|uniref:SET domain-containing protein n=1 Tax=Cucurbitaria berberidis CBS 394.84 TaxID=1168544 RepID=A0A9P4L8V5_9PLEO|nr:SET domain-containing protein [Cucurbitaria berberidis CBS 394.84]KAF1845584.1 SET domain-containing protein [Cucurbitaria berberidis CBS 394.84]
MARPDPIRNTYEEFPDELKELLKTGQNEMGRNPSTVPSRDILLHNHEWHLKFLVESAMPARNFVLPPAYPPSRASASEAKRVGIEDLRIDLRNPNDFILLRAITGPYVYSSTVTIVEGEYGQAARLTVCNLEDSIIDPIIPVGSILAIKQPCWSRLPTGSYHLRVDHPSDLEFLNQADGGVPKKWRNTEDVEENKDAATWKKDGDVMFLQKRFRKALELYNRAHARAASSLDVAAQIDNYRKRCGVDLVLLRFDAAAYDLSQAVSLYAKSNPSLFSSQLTEPSIIEAWLHNRSTDDPLNIASILPRPLKGLANRIKFDLAIYQTTPKYNLERISSYVGPLTLHMDVANYISDAEIKQTQHHGRGLFAARAFRCGDLITAEKAFALPAYLFNDRSTECSLYSLGDGTATDRAGALLFKELVQKLRHNPSLRESFFDLDDGGYWKERGWEAKEGDDIPVDVFRIEHIRRRNCFSAPLRSLDLLTIPSPVHNGFWIHSSYINHACLPNSARTFIGDILLLRATRDIAKDEELTSQYVAPELMYEERQEKFMGTWGFACDCTLCAVDKTVGMKLEGERMAIFEDLKSVAQRVGSKPTVRVLKRFTRRLRDLEALFVDNTYAKLPRLCLVHPTLFLTEAWRTLKNVDKTIGSATNLLRYFGIITSVEEERFKVLENSGLVNVETLRALKYMAEGYDCKGRTQVAGQIRKVASVWFRIITGADLGIDEFMRA